MVTGIEAGISHDPSETPEAQELWTPQYAAEIFLNSWPHSQGNPELQKHIFGYMHRQLPFATMPDQLKTIVMGLTARPIQEHATHNPLSASKDPSIVAAHPTPKAGSIPNEFMGRLNDMQRILNETDPVYGNVQALTEVIIRRDYRWLVGEFNKDGERVSEPGRPRSNPDVADPQRDPWLSHVIHYGLQGQATGHPLFDRMYGEINEYIRHGNASGDWGRNTDAMFDMVLQVYAEKHPHIQSDLTTLSFQIQEPVFVSS